MMALTQRRIPAQKTSMSSSESSGSDKEKNGGVRTRKVVMAILIVALMVGTALYMSGNTISDEYSSFLKGSTPSIALPPGQSFDIAPQVRVVVDFASNGDGSSQESDVALTTHKATLIVEKECRQNPGFWLRLEGEALVGVVLHEDKETAQWTGSFELPQAGKYQLVSYWYGCDGKSPVERKVLKENIEAKGSPSIQPLTAAAVDFPLSTWISSQKFPQTPQVQQPYVWHNPSIPTDKATLLKATDTSVSQEGAVVGDNGFHLFTKLSNYELVCFFGSQSAEDLRSSFLQIRPMLFSHQRPFKFHMYPTNHLERPDRDWQEETKKRLRKCKHILVSFDELEQPTTISQKEYTDQVTTLINHLLKVMPDDTFPIWMFSVMQSPSAAATNNYCHSPFLPRSSYHPCNAALKELFRNSPFPDRVRFLDNTDISLSQLGENRNDVLGAVALRIFSIVGKQVQTWRKSGQEGTIKGLVRGGTTTPNFELVPYTEWS